MTSQQLTIGEFARRTGLSLKALRLYDESGLLVPAAVDPGTGYRYYSPDQEPVATRISLLRRLDMPLSRVRTLVGTEDPTAATDDLLGWWADQERELAQRRGTVEFLVEDWRGSAPAPVHEVAHRRVPERLLASLTLNVLQAELVERMTDAVATVRAHLDSSGAEFGDEYWVIFHGVVSPDSDGPIEVCVPFEGVVRPSGRVVIRLEEARTEAYTPITAAQCRYPQILRAYDAVTRWVRRHGTASGSPREIYPVPWDCAPDAVVADIALPYREDVTR